MVGVPVKSISELASQVAKENTFTSQDVLLKNVSVQRGRNDIAQ